MAQIIIKVGTNVITQENGLLDEAVLESLVKQMATLRKEGHSIILISSGAMGAGRTLIQLEEKVSKVVERQVLASIGQVRLMNHYMELFQKEGQICSQVLTTKEDFRDRTHYLNMKNCFEGLLTNGVIPIVNENDVVSVDELMFTDNDELAGMIASMMNADHFIILTSVDGIYTGHPDDPTSDLIHVVEPGTDLKDYISPGTSSFGRGGMLTKAKIAKKMAGICITVHIANGKKDGILHDVLAGKMRGTCFPAECKRKPSSVKRWIAHSDGYEKGTITINQCAEEVLLEKIASLLPVGVVKVEGEFKKGDVLRIQNEKGTSLGFGIAAYGHETAKNNVGQKGKKALVHYDHLFLES